MRAEELERRLNAKESQYQLDLLMTELRSEPAVLALPGDVLFSTPKK